jgi:hypothetical protein
VLPNQAQNKRNKKKKETRGEHTGTKPDWLNSSTHPATLWPTGFARFQEMALLLFLSTL